MRRGGLERGSARDQEPRRLIEKSMPGDKAGFAAQPQGDDIQIVHNEGIFLLARRTED